MRDFRETKIKILSEEHSRAFQEAVIAAGGEWHEDGEFPYAHEQHYLYVDNDLVLEWGISASFFESHKYREIVFPLSVTAKNQEERNMKKFIGSKIVAAEPMTRLEYNQYRGWELPADENGTDGGYLVEYMDGGKSNHPNHSGYISWSPKEQFDKGYDSIVEVVKNPQPHVLRMQGEYTQLCARMKSLIVFQKTSIHESLSTYDQELLSLQLNQMSQYADTLRSRILQYM